MMGRALYALAFVAVGVVIGKACQYAAVGLLAPRLGFAAASCAGLLPFILLLVMLRRRFPRRFAWRDR